MEINFNDLQTKLNNLTIKKPPKTFLKILDKEYNEVLVSKYLAYFLNERNTTRDILKQILIHTSSKNDTDDFIELLNDAEFEDIFETWRSGNHDRIVIPDGGGSFNAGISDISKDRVPEIEAYLESKIQELYKVLDESIEEKKEAKRKEIQEKLKYKRIEL